MLGGPVHPRRRPAHALPRGHLDLLRDGAGDRRGARADVTNPYFNGIAELLRLVLPRDAAAAPDPVHLPGPAPGGHRPAAGRRIVALSLNYGSYMTEVFRSGIEAVPHGQTEAAQSLGMPERHDPARIVVPQAFRIVTPAIGNDFVAMIKDSSLAYVVGVQDVLWRAQRPAAARSRACRRSRGRVRVLGADDHLLAVPGAPRAPDGPATTGYEPAMSFDRRSIRSSRPHRGDPQARADADLCARRHREALRRPPRPAGAAR